MVKLSIISINYNNGIGLIKTIQSLSCQVFRDFELIVVDGGSTDVSLSVIEEYNEIITSWVSEPDMGIYNAMNKGISSATGEYCLFLNSGDYLIDNNVLDEICNNIIDEEIIYGNSLKVKPHYRRIIKYSSQLSLYDFYRTIPAIHHQATFIKRELFAKFGFYREDLKIIGDWDFFFRVIILKQVKTKYIDRTICVFDGTGISNTMNMDHPLRLQAYAEKETILKSNFPTFILNDYQKLDKILSKTSLWNRILNKITSFSFKR